MIKRLKGTWKTVWLIYLIAGIQVVTVPQDLIAGNDIVAGSSVFVFKSARKFFDRPISASSTRVRSKKRTRGGTEDDEDAPIDWINEVAADAVAERKTSDSEPFLSLAKGFLNSTAYFCESPQFPAAALKAGKQSTNLKVLVMVGYYGGILHATSTDGDAPFRSEIYKTLGTMNFRQSYFLGTPMRIEGTLSFTQNPGNTALCRDTTQELEVPALIDGGVLNNSLKTGTVPDFPADAKATGLRSVGAKVQVVIDEQGKVIQAKLIEGHETFGAAAVKSALNATFPRSMIAGKPVKVRGVLEFKQHPNNDVRFETKGSSGMTLPLFLAGSDSSYGSILR